MRKNKVDIITLGCSKNLVDSEQLMRQFVANGYTVEHDPHKINGEIVVVNTCGFIGDAQEESINMILELGEPKAERTDREALRDGVLVGAFLERSGEGTSRGRSFLREIQLEGVDLRSGQVVPSRAGYRACAHHPEALRLREDRGGMQPYLFLLFDPDHNRGLSIPSDGRDRRRGSWLGGARRERIPNDRPRSYVLWPRSL